MAQKKSDIVYLDIESVNPAAYNPRDITSEALEGLKESLKRFGMPQPLVINKSSDNLVSGHQRLKAAMAIGMRKVPVIYVELDEIQEKALNIALNNPAIQGHFTTGLQDLLGELKDSMGDEFISDLKMDALFDKEFIPDLPDENAEKEYKDRMNLLVEFKDKDEQQMLFDELNSRGYKVKMA